MGKYCLEKEKEGDGNETVSCHALSAPDSRRLKRLHRGLCLQPKLGFALQAAIMSGDMLGLLGKKRGQSSTSILHARLQWGDSG